MLRSNRDDVGETFQTRAGLGTCRDDPEISTEPCFEEACGLCWSSSSGTGSVRRRYLSNVRRPVRGGAVPADLWKEPGRQVV